VSFTSSCALFSDCTITFTPANWNIPQSMNVFQDPATFSSPCFARAGATGGGCPVENDAASILTASVPLTTMAHSWGDPHFQTFDNYFHDLFDTGDFYLVRQDSSDLVIQVRHRPCGNSASCNEAVAIRFNSATFFYVASATQGPTVAVVGDARSNGLTTLSTLRPESAWRSSTIPLLSSAI